MTRTKPLLQIDAGWLYVIAGLLICASGIIVPAQADLHILREQFDNLKRDETVVYARLEAHAAFLDQLDERDTSLLKRLAAAQLNMVPRSDTPVLVNASSKATIIDWIDATVADKHLAAPFREEPPQSLLTKLAAGHMRLWFLGGGVLCVFVGVILTPGLTMIRRGAVLRESDTHLIGDGDERIIDSDLVPVSESGSWFPPQSHAKSGISGRKVRQSEWQTNTNPVQSKLAQVHIEPFSATHVTQVATTRIDDGKANMDNEIGDLSSVAADERAMLFDDSERSHDTFALHSIDSGKPKEATLTGDTSELELAVENDTEFYEQPVATGNETTERARSEARVARLDKSPAQADGLIAGDRFVSRRQKNRIPPSHQVGQEPLTTHKDESDDEQGVEYVFVDEDGRELTADELADLEDSDYEWVEVDAEEETPELRRETEGVIERPRKH